MSRVFKNTSVRWLVSRASVISIAALVIVFAGSAKVAKAQAIAEGFDNLAGLLSGGDWVTVNHSDPLNSASPGWLQCFGTRIPPAHSGSTNSCVSADFAAGLAISTLNVWLIGPNRTFNNGDTLSFYTRESTGNPFPNRMQVRLSTSGTSVDVGTTATDVGVFTTLLLDLNSTYQVGGYPDVWTQIDLTISGLTGPTSGRFAFRYFVEEGGPDGDNSLIIGIDSLTYTPGAPVAPPQHVVDFDGDGKTDPAVVRASSATAQATWFIHRSSGVNRKGENPLAPGDYAQQWGIGSDFFQPNDYDGDNKTDIAVWRQGPPNGSFFYIFQSMTNTLRTVQFGQNGDDPTVTRDYTGDGKADPAVYRDGATGQPSFWHYLASSGPLSGQIVSTQFGQRNDVPVPGDYNRDAKSDFVVQRAANNGSNLGVFYIHNGTGGADVQIPSGQPGADVAVQFGKANDFLVPGDYDGDGKTDIATTRSVGGQYQWFIRSSLSGVGDGSTPSFIWGNSMTDFQTQGDYDGDGKTDVAVWRPNVDPAQNFYYILGSMSGVMAPFEWGQNGDYPVANFDTHGF